MKIEGADAISRAFSALAKDAKAEVDKAVQKNGEELVATAKLLIPVVSGESKAAIRGTLQADGSYLCDFGRKAKVIEGERGPRPFVNPALKALRKRHEGRNKRALNKALKKASDDA